jgi:proteasome accessory factor B
LVGALHQRRAVRFTYRAATTGQVRARTVEPWRLMARRGGWVLIGHDRDRDAARSFRLSRIEGAVRLIGPAEAFAPPDPQQLAEAEQSWSHGHGGVARLALAPERAEALRARALPAEPGDQDAPTGRDVVRVPFRATWELAEEVVGYGDAVLVLDPPEVRSAVLSLLRTAAGLGEVPRG